MKNPCHIHSLGVSIPQRILTNEDLSRIVETNDEWITTRTGIKERHIIDDGQQGSDLGLQASLTALAQANMEAAELTHIITATCTPEHLCPSTACIIAGKLGVAGAMTFDFNAACSGYIYGLSLCQSILSLNPNAKILFVCAEVLTRRVNWADRSTCVLFGDGAGACIITAQKENILASLEEALCSSDGSLQHLISIGGGTERAYTTGLPVDESFYLTMQGREVFKHAVRNMTAACQEVLRRKGMDIADVDLLVPHQANMRIIEAVGDRLGINTSHVFANVARYGNTSSASVPLALADARTRNLLGKGSRVLCTSFGGGLTWGACLLEFHS